MKTLSEKVIILASNFPKSRVWILARRPAISRRSIVFLSYSIQCLDITLKQATTMPFHIPSHSSFS